MILLFVIIYCCCLPKCFSFSIAIEVLPNGDVQDGKCLAENCKEKGSLYRTMSSPVQEESVLPSRSFIKEASQERENERRGKPVRPLPWPSTNELPDKPVQLVYPDSVTHKKLFLREENINLLRHIQGDHSCHLCLSFISVECSVWLQMSHMMLLA